VTACRLVVNGSDAEEVPERLEEGTIPGRHTEQEGEPSARTSVGEAGAEGLGVEASLACDEAAQ
jgi:hypothetical protein